MKIQHFLALVVFCLAPVFGARAAVRAGPFTNAANGHAYYLLNGNTWTASQAEARGLGGHLVTINDAAENEWVLNTFVPLAAPDPSLWIGLNDAANEGQFVWATGEPVTFTYWYPGEPNDLGGEDYIAIRYFTPPAGSWWDLSASSTAFGVVELSPPPTAVTKPADEIMPGSARLNGLADPKGMQTLAWFEWGTSSAYGNATPPQSVGSGNNAVGFSTALTGLVNGTEYHFRARASNAFGFAAGLDHTLNTRRPVVATLPAEPQTTISARLNGHVNPSGSPTLAWFEWGTSLAYGNTTPPESVGFGSNAVAFSNVLAGLTSGTEYHFRARASNSFGLEAGLDQTFTVSTNPPVIHWLAPFDGATFLTGATISLQARVVAAENTVRFVEFFATATNQTVSLGQVTSNFLSYYLLPWSNAPVGTFQLHAEAVDVVGGRGVSGSVQIAINNPPPPPLTWTGADPSGYWSAPANWSPASVPTNGAELVFPSGLPPGDMVSTNDLPESVFRSVSLAGGHNIRGNPITLTSGTIAINHSGTNVIACDLTFSGTPSTPYGRAIQGLSYGSGELTLTGNIGGDTVRVVLGRVVMRGQITGGILRLFATTLILDGDNLSPVSAEVTVSTLVVRGSQPNLNITMLREFETAACPYLSGEGAVGDVGGCGTVALDSTLSVKNIGGVGLLIRLNGTNVGEHGRVVASGNVNPSIGSLLPSADFNPQPGQVYTIVEKTSPGPVTNAIFGPEGTVTSLNGTPFRISYVGGDGNDVTLTAQPTNAVPVVDWLQPASNTAFPPGFTISLRARATDFDGTVSSVDFLATPTNGPTIIVGRGTLASSNGFYVREWTNPPPGQYQLHAEAVDNVGGRGMSDAVQIIVTGTNPPNSVAQTRTWTGADPSGYWSASANWVPAGVLVNGDDLVFPGGLPPEDKVSTNDFTDRVFRSIRFQAGGHTIRGNPITLTNRSDCIINSGSNVIACDLTFSGTPATPNYQSPSIRGQGWPTELTVIGNVGGGSLYVFSERLVIRGQFTAGSLFAQYGALALHGDNPHAVSAQIRGSSASTFRVQGSQPNLDITMLWEMESASCPTLIGNGVVGDVTGCGYIIPDPTLSVKNIGPSIPPTVGWRILNIHLNGTNAGEYSRLVASGDVSVSSGRLFPSAGFNPQPGQVYTIVAKTSPGPITNAIFGAEGTVTILNGVPCRISYVGDDGNDVTLTAIPPVPITLSRIQRSFGTQTVFSYSADAGLRYAVERSATWSNWTTIRTDTANTNPMTVIDDAATNEMNFYRVRRLPNP